MTTTCSPKRLRLCKVTDLHLKRTMGIDISEVKPGCPMVIAWFVMPVMSMAAATLGLIFGATLTFECRRVEVRVVEQVLETSGNITRPVDRVVQPGRVDVTITSRIIGLFPMRRVVLSDVIGSDASSGTNYVKDRSSRRTTSYESGRIKFATRGGATWESWDISNAFGASPAEVGERVKAFIEADSPDTLQLRIIPWLSNVVGVPFAFVVLWFVRMWIARFRGSLVSRRGAASQTQ